MSKNLLPLKINNPKYIVLTYKMAIQNKNYASSFYRFKYTILFYRYSFHNKTSKLLKLIDIPFYFIGYIYSLYDNFRIDMFIKK